MALPKLESYRKFASGKNYGTHAMKMTTDEMVLYFTKGRLAGYILPHKDISRVGKFGYWSSVDRKNLSAVVQDMEFKGYVDSIQIGLSEHGLQQKLEDDLNKKEE